MNDELRRIRERVQGLLSERSLREPAWRMLSRWVCPWRGWFEEVGADRLMRDEEALFTGAASGAVLRGASGITSGMTPRNISWFTPEFSEEGLDEIMGARQWLDGLDLAMKDCLARGGFYQAIQNFNIDLLWSGCGLLYCEKGETAPLRFECVQVGTFSVALDQNQRLCAVQRAMRMGAGELARVFGRDRLSTGARKKAEKNPFELLRINHYVERKGEGVESCWWEEAGDGEFLRKSRFYEMPYFFTTWNEGRTVYGTGPGDEVLADARQLDRLERHKLEGIDKLIHPPVVAHPSLKDSMNLEPGGITYAHDNLRLTPLLDLSPYAQAMAGIQNEIATVENRINQGLMASIFTSMPLDQRPRDMSATEFLERKREALQQMGPVISAYEPNVLTPCLYRTMASLEREGLLPVLPQELRGLPLAMKIDFISPMANALRQTGAETTRAIFLDVANMYQATQREEIFDKINLDQMVDELATGLGAPAAIIRSDEEVAKIREERQKQLEEMQKAQMEAEAKAMAQEQAKKEGGQNEAQNTEGRSWI